MIFSTGRKVLQPWSFQSNQWFTTSRSQNSWIVTVCSSCRSQLIWSEYDHLLWGEQKSNSRRLRGTKSDKAWVNSQIVMVLYSLLSSHDHTVNTKVCNSTVFLGCGVNETLCMYLEMPFGHQCSCIIALLRDTRIQYVPSLDIFPHADEVIRLCFVFM